MHLYMAELSAPPITPRRHPVHPAGRERALCLTHEPPWNTADTTQRAVLLMTEVTCMRDVVLVREAGGAGGIFGIAALGCVLHACYLHRIHNIPYSGYFLLFLKFTALYTLYSSLGFPLYIFYLTQLSTLRHHCTPSREQNVETHYRSV